MTSFLLSAALAASLIGTTYAAQPKEKASAPVTAEVDGQIFIVTKGQQAVKLALVSVMLLTEQDMENYLSQRVAAINKQRSDLAPQMVARKQAITELIGDRQARIDEYMAISADFTRANRAAPRDPIAAKAYNMSAEYRAALSRFHAASASIQPLLDELNAYPGVNLGALSRQYDAADKGPSSFFADMLNGVTTTAATTKTDADGKFSFKTKMSPRMAVLARASRLAGDKDEVYEWVVWVPRPHLGEKGTVTLANDNLLGSNCIECVAYASRLDPHPELSQIGK